MITQKSSLSRGVGSFLKKEEQFESRKMNLTQVLKSLAKTQKEPSLIVFTKGHSKGL